MAMSVGGSGDGPKAEINITPLVDVVLVLLIIFMVVTPMLQKGIEVQLPKAGHVIQGKEQAPLIITINDKKDVYIDKEMVGLDNLTTRVVDEMTMLPGRTILLKGDRSLQWGDVRKTMDNIRKAKVNGVEQGQVSLATEQKAGVAPPDAAPEAAK
jgi:biopolymer transport protein ExbD